MKYQYFKGDFTVVETFKRDGAAVPVPDRVIVYYFTKKYAGRVVCERNGDSFRNCRLSNDGMSLICSVALSRKCIGIGLLCHNVIEVAENEDFPRSEQFLPIPEVVVSDGDNVMIYDGPSDNTNEIVSGVVLARIFDGTVIVPVEYGTGQNSVRQKSDGTVASGTNSAAFGYESEAKGFAAFAEGEGTQANGRNAHAEGANTTASGFQSHAEGYKTRAGDLAVPTEDTHHEDGDYTHAEGISTLAKGSASHAEGAGTQALVRAAHAEGRKTISCGNYSHSEGFESMAGVPSSGVPRPSMTTGTAASREGYFSHAEGHHTLAQGNSSHAEGKNTEAVGIGAHSEGMGTQTLNEAEHAEGKFNKSNKASSAYGNAGNTQHSVGIGSSASNRSNAFEIMQNGDLYVLGVGGYDGKNATSQVSKPLSEVLGEQEEASFAEIDALFGGETDPVRPDQS